LNRLAVCHKVLSALCLLVLMAGCSFGPPWTQKSELLTGRVNLTTSVVDGKIYVIGGFEGSTGNRPGSTRVEVYDPSKNTWTSEAGMLTGRGGLASEVMDGKIYTLGGSESTADAPIAAAEVYDTKTNSWSKLPDMLDAVDWAAASQVDGKIYVIGGTQYNTLTQERISIASVEEFDPQTSTWVRKTDMPTPRYALSSCVIGGKIYVVGGLISTFQMVTPALATQALEIYDPATDSWEKKADMPEPRASAALAVFKGKIYIFGGTDYDSGLAKASIFVYDPDKGTWTTESDMPFKRLGLSASVANGKIYIIGGSARSFPSDSPVLPVWEYRP
jgi:N-acetylneuraminic acid mutarotase